MTTLLDNELLALNGEPIDFGDGKKQTLRDVAIFAVLSAEAETLEGPAKYKRYELAKKLKEAKSTDDLVSEEITEIKVCIGKVPMFGVVTVGSAYDALEGK